MTDYTRHPRQCSVCREKAMAPEVLSYSLLNDQGKPVTVWAHSSCAQQAHFAKYGVPELSLEACGGMGEGER